MDFEYIKLPKGIQMRKPFPSELDYFKTNTSVAGMATEDNKVILNPYTKLSPAQLQSVANNESARIYVRTDPAFKPDFELTVQQKTFLDTTTYRNASDEDRKATIAARILSGDSSAGVSTTEQDMFVDTLKQKWMD